MTTRNINKIKPWMLAKNTEEIVSSYVQKIYKQTPLSFNKGLKTSKVATSRPENRGPLSTWKNQQKQLPGVSITPRIPVAKNSKSKFKQHANNVQKFFENNKTGHQATTKLPSGNVTPSKRVLKTPNYKIYNSLRYGSSCSSSRSSIFRRYDDRRRAKQSNLSQINYLVRSFHTSKFEPTYARFLMPARNQQLDTKLGSIPDAIQFSNNMLKDLMKVKRLYKNTNGVKEQIGQNMKPPKGHGLDKWNRPPSLSKYKIKSPKACSVKASKSKSLIGNSMKKTNLLPESREYARLNVLRTSQFKQPKPANELFIAQHDRQNTELHEKHRRNRMKKLGLIKSPTASEQLFGLKNENQQYEESKVAKPQMYTATKQFKQLKLCNQLENKTITPSITKNTADPIEQISREILEKSAVLTNFAKKETFKSDQKSCTPLSTKSNSIKTTPTKYTSFINSATVPVEGYSTVSPIVALRAQMLNKSDLGSYRYHPHDFFSAKKY